MRLVVLGANGQTGQQLVLQALAAGHEVTGIVRNPDRFTISYDRLKVAKGDALDGASLGAAFPGHDAVLSVLGVTGFANSLRPMTFYADTARMITRAMRECGVPRLVAVTSVGVLHDPATPIWYRTIVKPLLRHKYADMTEMEKVIAGSGLPFTIVRPVRLANGSLTQRYRIGADGNLPRGGIISRADVADFMVRRSGDFAFRDKAVALSY